VTVSTNPFCGGIQGRSVLGRRLRATLPGLLLLAATSTASSLPLANAADSAQKVARLAYVDPYSPSTTPAATSAFWARLQELGWVRGQNLIVDTRWAEGRTDRLPRSWPRW